MIRIPVFFLMILLLAGCNNENEKQIESLLGPKFSEKQIDNFIDKQMEYLEMPGLSIAIINNGQVVYHRVKGFADKENKLPITTSSIFEGASISKSVFGYFVLTFVEDGSLDLDKPLYEYLPYPDIEDDERYKKITARMILSHRSGLPNWRDDYEKNQLFLKFDPGTDYFYSGEGYQYLALVLRNLLNTNWAGLEEEFQKRVANPLEMKHTKFIQDDFIRQHKVKPYDKELNKIDKSKMEWWLERDSVFVAPTTIHSESIDFSKWIIAMINEEGLSQEGFNTLFKTHSEIGGNKIMKSDYSLGFGKTTILNSKVFFSHNGNNTGFSSLFMFDKKKGWGLVYFTNSEFGDAFGNKLIYEFLMTGWSINKQISIGILLVFSLATLFLGLIMLFRKKSVLNYVSRTNLKISVMTLLTLLVIFSLMFFGVASIGYVYFIGLILMFTIIVFCFLSLRRLVGIWNKKNETKLELIFHSLIPLTVLILIGVVLTT